MYEAFEKPPREKQLTEEEKKALSLSRPEFARRLWRPCYRCVWRSVDYEIVALVKTFCSRDKELKLLPAAFEEAL
ncbi:hypothetical protein NDU88_002969 [Pleurodeles waltl]|uniref:Uncharacterized protein n=1 Tax=Pleurodeles waltl TaxID=8319 RepID=A0AAV7SC38_PLEWA|nr:hypothetical protein NDU88_002969 [Pleurodeles waltl]